MRRVPPFNPSTGEPDDAMLPWQNGNPATGTEGSIPPHQAWTHAAEEIVHVIEHSGQSPSGSDLQQLRKAIAQMVNAAMQGFDPQDPPALGEMVWGRHIDAVDTDVDAQQSEVSVVAVSGIPSANGHGRRISFSVAARVWSGATIGELGLARLQKRSGTGSWTTIYTARLGFQPNPPFGSVNDWVDGTMAATVFETDDSVDQYRVAIIATGDSWIRSFNARLMVEEVG